MFSPGILHPDNTPPATTGPDHKRFAADLDNSRELARGVVAFNRAEAQRQAEQYYTQLTLQIKKGSWVLVLREGMPAPESDRIPNRKLSCKWVGPFRFEGMANPALAKLQCLDEQGRAIKEFLVTPPRSDSTNAPCGAPSSDLARWLTLTSLSHR